MADELAAGISMGLSLLAQGTLRHHLPDTEWRSLITSRGYALNHAHVVHGEEEPAN